MTTDLMRPARRRSAPGRNGAATDLIRYWVAEVLSTPQVWRKGWCRHEQRFEHDDLLELLKLSPNREGKLRRPPKALSAIIGARSLDQLLAEDDTYCKLSQFGQRLSLSEAERRLLTFASHMHVSGLLYRACELVADLSPRQVQSHLARFIDVPESALREAVGAGGVLRASGMLLLSHSGSFRGSDLTDILQIENELQEMLQLPDVPDTLLTSLFYRLSEPATLSLDDFIEHADETAMLQRLLKRAVTQQRVGINVLIYGPPGTGKTQLVRALTESLGYTLAMVPETDREGDGISAAVRLGRYNACQRALANDQQTLVAFDEAEDCLCDSRRTLFFSAARQTPKAAVIRLLESNPRPTLWISNRVEMDAAFLRRFTHVLLLDNPGAAQRTRLVNDALAEVPVSQEFRQQVAKLEQVPPAILHTSLDFARLAGEGEQDVERLMTHSLNTRLLALGRSERLKVQARSELPWRASCLRASEDVVSLLEEIREDAEVRLCLNGAPGTGKTAWARQLAERLGRPLMVRQASDLLDMYVGNTEKMIAAMFQQAERDGAVLVVDEADSFIGSRAHATQSWEISHVNQFLASMENYGGIFIATTNLMERVDQAAMRRFDFIIRFAELDLDGATLLLGDLADAYGIALPELALQRVMLQDIRHLTPGDFAAVHRRLRVRKQYPDAAGLVTLLRETVRYKSMDEKPIGFSAQLQ